MAATWLTVRVFISSTFRDMHAERDHLVRFVFPRLRETLAKRRVHLVDVDLRWGVTSDQDAQQACRDIIGVCRPHFICLLGERYGFVPAGKELSITADEIDYAAFNSPLSSGHHFFYFRDPAATAEIPEMAASDFREPPASPTAGKLVQLKESIRTAGYEPFIYRPTWNADSQRFENLEPLGQRVFTDLLTSIDRQFGQYATEPVDEFADQQAQTEAFIAQEIEHFVAAGRQSQLEELSRFSFGEDASNIFLLTGPPGIGKTALLCQFCHEQTQCDATVTICHIVGASVASTNVRQMLLRFCHALGQPMADTVSLGHRALVASFRNSLAQMSVERPVVLVVDGLDQLEDDGEGGLASWLPSDLPERVRVVLSSREHESLDALCERVEGLCARELAELAGNDRARLVTSVLERYQKRMSPDQRQALLSKDDAGSPLYLLVALEELRTLGEFEAITDYVTAMPGKKPELFLWILRERLSREAGLRDPQNRYSAAQLVSRFASFLSTSRNGLTHDELVQLLDPGDPAGNVAALERLMRHFLMFRGDLLDFQHAYLRQIVTEQFMGESDRIAGHGMLADFFAGSGEDSRRVAELPFHLTHGRRWQELETTLLDLAFLESKVAAGEVHALVNDLRRAFAALPLESERRDLLRCVEMALRADVEFLARHPQTLFQCLWNRLSFRESLAANGPAEVAAVAAANASATQSVASLHQLLGRWRDERTERDPGLPWLRSLLPAPISPHSQPSQVFRGHTVGVSGVKLSQDEQRLLTYCGSIWGGCDPAVSLWHVGSGKLLSEFQTHNDGIASAVLSADGRRVATAGCFAGACVQLWDVATGRELYLLQATGYGLKDIAFSTNGKQLLATDSSTLVTWDAASGECLSVRDVGTRDVIAGGWSSKGPRLASLSQGGSRLYIQDLNSGDDLTCISMEGLTLVRFWPDGESLVYLHPQGWRRLLIESHEVQVLPWPHNANVRQFAVAADSATTAIVDWWLHLVLLHSGTGIEFYQRDACDAVALDFSPDGKWLAIGGSNGTIELFDVRALATGRTLGPCRGSIQSMAFSPDSAQLVVACDEVGGATLEVWNVACGTSAANERHDSNCSGRALLFSPDGSHLYVVGGTTFALEVETSHWKTSRQITRHTRFIEQVVPTSQGTLLISVSWDGTIRLFDADSGKDVVCCRGSESQVIQVCLTADCRYLAAAFFTGVAQVWQVPSGQPASPVLPHGGRVHAVALTPEGRYCATGNDGGSVIVWETESGSKCASLQADHGEVLSLRFCVEGHTLLIGTKDGSVRTWEWQSVQGTDQLPPLANVAPRGGDMALAVFSPVGDLLAAVAEPVGGAGIAAGMESALASLAISRTRTENEPIEIWNLHSGRVVATIRDAGNHVLAVAFSHDGRQLAVAGTAPRVSVWDVQSGACLVSLPFEEPWLESSPLSLGEQEFALGDVAFAPDDTRLLAVSRRGQYRIWDWRASRETEVGFLGGPHSLAFTADGNCLLAASQNASSGLFAAGPGLRLAKLSLGGDCLAEFVHPFLKGRLNCVVDIGDGNRIVAGGTAADLSGVIVFWDVPTGMAQIWYGMTQQVVTRLSCHGPPRQLVVQTWPTQVDVYDASCPIAPRCCKSADELAISRLQFDDKHDRVVTVSLMPDRRSVVLHRELTPPEQKDMGLSSDIQVLVLAEDAARLVLGLENGTLVIVDLDTDASHAIRIGIRPIQHLSLSRQGEYLALIEGDSRLNVWDLKNQRPLLPAKDYGETWECVALSPAGHLLAAMSASTIALWDLGTRKQRYEWPRESFVGEGQLSFSPDGRWLACHDGGEFHGLSIYDCASGEITSRLGGGTPRTPVAWSPDGQRLAFGSDSLDGQAGLVSVHDLHHGTQHGLSRGPGLDLLGPETVPTCLAFSHDGTRLACGHEDGSVAVWLLWDRCALLESVQGDGVDTVWQRGRDRQAYGFFPATFDWLSRNDAGTHWAAALTSRLQILQLEGLPPIQSGSVGMSGEPAPTNWTPRSSANMGAFATNCGDTNDSGIMSESLTDGCTAPGGNWDSSEPPLITRLRLEMNYGMSPQGAYDFGEHQASAEDNGISGTVPLDAREFQLDPLPSMSADHKEIPARSRFTAGRPTRHGDPDVAMHLNLAHQRALAIWRALPWWRRLFTPKPRQPDGI